MSLLEMRVGQRDANNQKRNARRGSVSTGKPRYTLEQHAVRDVTRFWRQVIKRSPEECWEWTGLQSDKGYGRIWFMGGHMFAHVASFIIANARLPKALVCHDCDNPSCMNPAHFFEGTYHDNNHDCISKGRARKAVGEKASKAKLTEAQVAAIRREYVPFKVSTPALARKYGVAPSTIYNIVSRTNWRHL